MLPLIFCGSGLNVYSPCSLPFAPGGGWWKSSLPGGGFDAGLPVVPGAPPASGFGFDGPGVSGFGSAEVSGFGFVLCGGGSGRGGLLLDGVVVSGLGLGLGGTMGLPSGPSCGFGFGLGGTMGLPSGPSFGFGLSGGGVGFPSLPPVFPASCPPLGVCGAPLPPPADCELVPQFIRPSASNSAYGSGT